MQVVNNTPIYLIPHALYICGETSALFLASLHAENIAFSGVTLLGIQFLVQTVPPRIVFILSIFFYFPSLFMCFCFSVLCTFLYLLIMPIHTHKK